MNILIVEDKDENRYMLETLLKGNGYGVQSAANGAEALERLKSGNFDLIISDILMPVMDGFALCRKVKTDENLRHIPFIIYTATYTGEKDEEFAIKIGADRFVIKPCEPEDFIEIVHSVLAEVRDGDMILETAPIGEEEALKLYNERLVRKLEKRMLQLEREVQARQKAEETLRQSEEMYRSLYNSIRDAIAVSDTNRTIIDCNRAFVEMFGYSLEEISGKNILIIYENEEEFMRFGVELEKHVNNKTNFLYNANFKKKDGTIFPGEVNAYYLHNDDGTLTGFIGLIRDITERKQSEKIQKELESQLRQAQKMEAIGLLAGGVAHDFNNLLSIIIGYEEILLETTRKDHPYYEPMQQIYQAGLRAKDLTRQLLAFSRKQILEMKPENVNNIITGFEKLLRRLIGEDIKLVLELAPGPLTVKADSAQLEQVLMNLAVNARDAMPNGGILKIKTAVAELNNTQRDKTSELPPGSYVIITVSDTGCGIKNELMERIFEPFFTTKGNNKGTGLGLATSYGIIMQHGGKISVESELNKGTVFSIYLPLHPEDDGSKKIHPVKHPSPVSGLVTVMVVEDDSSVRKLACQILADQGYTVIESNDAKDAISRANLHSGPIHLVLTDVIMPGIKGPEAFEKIHERHPEARVLYMSGYTDSTIALIGSLKKGNQFIQKPFKVNELLEKCRQILNE
ncbi:MAG TPA: response regulator [Desulfomonilia bacterium]